MKIEFSNNSIPVKLIELFDYVIGGDWGKDPEYQDEEFELAYCIRGSEFKNWNEYKGKTASLRKIKKKSILTRKLQEGDILIEISGGGPDQPVGRTVLIDKTVLSFRPEIPKICTNFLRLARPIKFIDSKYLNYFLTFFYYSGDVIAYQGGSNNLRNLKFNDYCSIQVPLVPLPEQHRIVAKIEELFTQLDKGIESLKTAQQQLKIYRQAVLKWAFEGKLTKGLNHDASDFSEEHDSANQHKHSNHTHHNHQSSDNGDLPKGWKVDELKKITVKAKKVKIKEQNPNEEFIYLDIGCIDNTVLKIVSYKKYKWEDAPSRAQQIVEIGDTLFSTVRTYLKNIAFVDKEIYQHQVASSGFTVIRADKTKIEPKYLFYYTTYQGFINPLNNLQTGTSYPAVRDEDVFSQLISYPVSKEEQRLIVSEIEKRLSVCDKLEESINAALQQAEALRQSILKKAFEGKLVEQDPNDEPASVLLERIRAEREKNKPDKSNKKSKKSQKSK